MTIELNRKDAALRQRILIAVFVATLHVAAIFGLIAAFAGGVRMPDAGDLALLSIFVAKPKPPPPRQPPIPQPPVQQTPVQQKRRSHGGAPLPAARQAKAAPEVAAAIIPLSRPSPRNEVSGAGSDQSNGSAQSGQGSGGGGEGQGAGSGAGDEEDGGTDLREISGGIYQKDYPRDALRAHQTGDVHIRFTVGIDGRVSDCRITRSSGSASLDGTTCRLITERFRYEPARDAQGRPHADTVEGVHEWRIGGRAADPAE
ncbi:MAG: energy transducer TonB [Novosphingobium sp.]